MGFFLFFIRVHGQCPRVPVHRAEDLQKLKAGYSVECEVKY